MGLNFERENAREWQEDRGPISDSSDHESLNDDLVEYDGYHMNEAPDEDSKSNWQQVTNKKQSAKQHAGPKTQFPIKNAPNRFSGRVRPPPPTQRSKAPPNRGSPPPSQRSKVPPNRGSRPLAPLRRTPTSQRQQPSQGLASLPLDKSRPAPIQRFRQVKKITFSTKNDNPAKAAFRAELPHTGTFVLSRPCYLIERDRTKLYAMFEEMGVRLGSFIRPPQHLMDKTLLLWGDTRQVEATKQELQHLIKQAELISPSPAKTDHFAKSNDVAEPMAKTLDKKMKRDATRQIYQKAPDPNLKFNSIGTFIWPVEEVRPDELLGPSYEAFDLLRMLHQVYIVFNNSLGVFNIMSDNDKAVRDVIARIIGTIKEFAARSTREVTALMVEPPSLSDMRKDIKLVAGKNMDTACIPVLTGTNLSTKEMMSWEKTCNEMTDAHFVRIRNALRRALPQLRYYRGRVQMRVLLGTFALKTFRRWPEGVTSIPFESFLDNIKVPATKGQMIKEYVTSSLD